REVVRARQQRRIEPEDRRERRGILIEDLAEPFARVVRVPVEVPGRRDRGRCGGLRRRGRSRSGLGSRGAGWNDQHCRGGKHQAQGSEYHYPLITRSGWERLTPCPKELSPSLHSPPPPGWRLSALRKN